MPSLPTTCPHKMQPRLVELALAQRNSSETIQMLFVLLRGAGHHQVHQDKLPNVLLKECS
eukprot:726291-Pelagomonas_calceolata.AAC.1